MIPAEIIKRLDKLEKDLLMSGNPPKFAATQAYKQVLNELDAQGFKRFESVFMVYKAREIINQNKGNNNATDNFRN